MDADMYMKNMDVMIPAALFIVIEGLSAAPAMAGDGVVILEREVPARPAYRDGALGRATSIDTSPDDKVKQVLNGQHTNLNSKELGDADFAMVSTGVPQSSNVMTDQINASGLASSKFGNNALNSTSGISSAVQSFAPTLTGSISSATGGATGHIANSVIDTTSALSGLVGTIARTSGQ